MEDQSQNFLAQLGVLWEKLNPNERLVIISSVLILIVAVGVWIAVTRQPAYALLYGGLDATDAGEVISELQGQGVPYKIQDSGQSVFVPADRVDELRINLASEGFTPTGIDGYELFDQSNLFVGDFLQRKQAVRAIEGELAKTLISLEEVSMARVHLTIPEPTPFISEETEPMASVVLRVNPPGASLSRENIAAVRTFVAGAIGSLQPDNVTIIDQNMNLLTGPTMTEPGGLMPTQEEARRNYENERTQAIRALLERAYGVGNVAVSFSCEMDFDTVKTESLEYEPIPGTDHGVLVSEEMTESSAEGEGYAPPVGVPGTESNIPSYPGTSTQPYETEQSTMTKNYEVSSSHEIRTQAPGTVKMCSVSVLINSSGRKQEEITQTEVNEVEELVASSALIDTTRGDVITVAFREFDTRLEEELDQQQSWLAGRELRDYLFKFAIAAALVGIWIVIVRNFMKPIERTFLVGAGFAGKEEEEEEGAELPPTDPEALERIKIKEEIERMIRDDPASAAKVIRTWLKE